MVISCLIVTHHPRRPHQFHPLSVLSFISAAAPFSFFTFPFSQLFLFHTLADSFVVFCTLQKLNSFVSKRFRTLCAKHPGVGWGSDPSSQKPSPLVLFRSVLRSRIFSFVFKSLRTLPFSVSCNPFACHSYENCRGVYQLFPFWNSQISRCAISLDSDFLISLPPYFIASSPLPGGALSGVN